MREHLGRMTGFLVANELAFGGAKTDRHRLHRANAVILDPYITYSWPL